jgi:hypothetical protein
LGGGKALISRLSKPAYRNGMVLRDTVASLVHEPEIVLGIDFAVVRKGAPQSDRGRIVPALCRGQCILKRPCGDRSSKGDCQDDSGDGCFERDVHDRSSRSTGSKPRQGRR